MSDVVVPGSADATIPLSIHGPAGVLDLETFFPMKDRQELA